MYHRDVPHHRAQQLLLRWPPFWPSTRHCSALQAVLISMANVQAHTHTYKHTNNTHTHIPTIHTQTHTYKQHTHKHIAHKNQLIIYKNGLKQYFLIFSSHALTLSPYPHFMVLQFLLLYVITYKNFSLKVQSSGEMKFDMPTYMRRYNCN